MEYGIWTKCANCGKWFVSCDKHRTYCSLQCRSMFFNNKYKNKNAKKELDPKQCKTCNKFFVPFFKASVYCSDSCRESVKCKKRIDRFLNPVDTSKNLKRNRLNSIILNDLKDKPSDSICKRFNACRG